MRPTLLLCAMLFLTAPWLQGEEEPHQPFSWMVELFSDKGRAFSPLLADPREAQFRMVFLRETNVSDTYWDLGFGGDLGLFRNESTDGGVVSLTVRGLIAARFEFFSQSFDLLNTDFIGGAALGYAKGKNAFEGLLYHQSSHLGDEILDRQERRRIDYSREAFRFLWSRDVDPVRVYGGPTYNFRGDPRDVGGAFTIQAGVEYPFLVHGRPFFAALDLQSKQENDWNLNSTLVFGLDLGNPERVANRQRLMIELFNGYSNMGQFYHDRERYIGIGLGFNF